MSQFFVVAFWILLVFLLILIGLAVILLIYMDSAAIRKDPSQPICSPSVGLHELSVNPDQAKATTHGVLRAVCIQDEEVGLPLLVCFKGKSARGSC